MDARWVLFWGSYVVIVICVISIAIHSHVTGRKHMKMDTDSWVGFFLLMIPGLNHAVAFFILLWIIG